MHERPRRGGHHSEVCLPLQDLSRLGQTVGGQVFLDQLKELLLGEADVGLGNDGGPVQGLEGEVALVGTEQSPSAVIVGPRHHCHELVGGLLELDMFYPLVE